MMECPEIVKQRDRLNDVRLVCLIRHTGLSEIVAIPMMRMVTRTAMFCDNLNVMLPPVRLLCLHYQSGCREDSARLGSMTRSTVRSLPCGGSTTTIGIHPWH